MSEIIKIVFMKMLLVSSISGILIIVMLLISPLLKKSYSVKWRYWAWLLLAVWLLVPFTYTVQQAPIQITISDTIVVFPTVETPTASANPTANASSANVGQPIDVSTTENTTTKTFSTMASEITTFATTLISKATLLDILIVIWLMGIAVFLIKNQIMAWHFRSKLQKKWRPCDNVEVAKCIRQTMDDMGFHKEMDIKFCREIQSPFVIGLLHPVLVLPDVEFDHYLLMHIIRHELTHCVRRDLWYKLLINLANAVHWFNPMMWVMNRTSDRDLELVCDELVTSGHDISSRKDYGESILLTVKPGTDRRPAALTTSFSVGAKNLKERFESIMLDRVKRNGIVFLVLVVLLAGIASFSTGLALEKLDEPVSKPDWSSYANTRWISPETHAELYFKDYGKNRILFDFYIYQIKVLENVETNGVLTVLPDGYISTINTVMDDLQVRVSITFATTGDYIIVNIVDSKGTAIGTGSYRLEKTTLAGNDYTENDFLENLAFFESTVWHSTNYDLENEYLKLCFLEIKEKGILFYLGNSEFSSEQVETNGNFQQIDTNFSDSFKISKIVFSPAGDSQKVSIKGHFFFDSDCEEVTMVIESSNFNELPFDTYQFEREIKPSTNSNENGNPSDTGKNKDSSKGSSGDSSNKKGATVPDDPPNSYIDTAGLPKLLPTITQVDRNDKTFAVEIRIEKIKDNNSMIPLEESIDGWELYTQLGDSDIRITLYGKTYKKYGEYLPTECAPLLLNLSPKITVVLRAYKNTANGRVYGDLYDFQIDEKNFR